MIITRTPLRITLGGGGTDLPSYYERFGGIVISAAINKYIFIAINPTFTDDYFLKYSAIERVERSRIDHPIIREVFPLHDLGPAVEMVSVADIPAGTGLGSSGSFTVGLLRALYAFQREHVTSANLAEEACRIEIERLDRPVGKQDQYIAAFGGLTCFEFDPRRPGPRLTAHGVERDAARPGRAPAHVLHRLLPRRGPGPGRAEGALRRRRPGDGGEPPLRQGTRPGQQVALERGTRTFAKLMDEHWQHKRQRSRDVQRRDRSLVRVGMAHGALGGSSSGPAPADSCSSTPRTTTTSAAPWPRRG